MSRSRLRSFSILFFPPLISKSFYFLPYIAVPIFPDSFKYHCVGVADEETEDLSVHFEQAHKFISDAQKNGGRVLVHW